MNSSLIDVDVLYFPALLVFQLIRNGMDISRENQDKVNAALGDREGSPMKANIAYNFGPRNLKGYIGMI